MDLLIPVDFRDDREGVEVRIKIGRGSQVYSSINDMITSDAWSLIHACPKRYQDWCDAAYFMNTGSKGFKPQNRRIVSLWNYLKLCPLDNSLTTTVAFRKSEGKYEFMDGRHRAIVLCHLKAPFVPLLVPTVQLDHFIELLT